MDLQQYNIKELEGLYDQKVKEYRANKSQQDQIKGALDVQFKEFANLYNKLPPALIAQFALRMEKSIVEMNQEEQVAFLEKLNNAYATLYKKLDTYLKSGAWEDDVTIANDLATLPISNLVIVQQPETVPDEPQAKDNFERVAEDAIATLEAILHSSQEATSNRATATDVDKLGDLP